MTREGNIKWAKEIDAQRQGKTIQVQQVDGNWFDEPNPSFTEVITYRIKPERYQEKVEAFAQEFQAKDAQGKPVEENGVPVVRPPVGGDAYILARLWEFWPILEFKRGESYRIHLSSTDWQHGFSLQPTNINISVHPGYEHVITLTPTGNGDFGIICNEFCGIGHHTMTGRIRVVD